MGVSEKSIIDPEDLKPGLPVKKTALLAAVGTVVVAGFVVSLLTSGGSGPSKSADAQPEPKPKAVRQEAGKARTIDEEIKEAQMAVEREERESRQRDIAAGRLPPNAQNVADATAAPKAGASAAAGPGTQPLPAAVRRTNQTAALYEGKFSGPGGTPNASQMVGAGAAGVGKPPAGAERSTADLQYDAQARTSNALAYDNEAADSSSGVGALVNTVFNHGEKTGEAVGKAAQGASMIDYKDPVVKAPSQSIPSPFAMFGGAAGPGGAAGGGFTRTSAGGGNSEKSWLSEVAGEPRNSPLRSYTTGSRYTLHQGKVMPAVLGRDINTDLPGEMTAYTTIDVYDSLGNGYMLIPKGSVLVGQFNSDVKIGQARVNFAFKRLIMPDGRSFDLPAAQANDLGGAAGLEGDVDNHFFTMFASSFAIAWVADRVNTAQPTSVTVIGGGSASISPAGQVLIDVSKTILERNKRIAPTITIPKGTRFNVEVVRDMEFPGPYRRSSE